MANNNWGWILLALGTAAASGLFVYSIMRSKEQRLQEEKGQLMQSVARRNRDIESLEQRLSILENIQLQYNELQREYNELIAKIDYAESQVIDPQTRQILRELKARARKQKLEQEQLAVR